MSDSQEPLSVSLQKEDKDEKKKGDDEDKGATGKGLECCLPGAPS